MCCSLWKGIVELRELEITIHSTTQMSSKLDRTLTYNTIVSVKTYTRNFTQ